MTSIHHVFFGLAIVCLIAGCSETPDSNNSTAQGETSSEPETTPEVAGNEAPQEEELETATPEENLPETPAATADKPSPDHSTADNSPEGESKAMALYDEARTLMKAGKTEEGYRTAQQAMQEFIAEKNDLAWMMLETIEQDDAVIMVHFNMGEKERDFPNDGIVRPLTFRVLSRKDPSAEMRFIDFELARFDGNTVSAAIGETTQSGHANYGIMSPQATYKEIKAKALDVIKRMSEEL